MWLEATSKPICYQWPGGEIILTPGHPRELPEDRARRLLERAAGKVRVVEPESGVNGIRPGVWVEWLSPALPKQRGEVLAVYPDGTFLVFHPLTEADIVLPITWVKRIVKGPRTI